MTREQSDILIRIKRALLDGHYAFSRKARLEMQDTGLVERDVIEAIINAPAIYKEIRSRSPLRKNAVEYLYVIYGVTFDGLLIYTKGKFIKSDDDETFYFLISSKRSE